MISKKGIVHCDVGMTGRNAMTICCFELGSRSMQYWTKKTDRSYACCFVHNIPLRQKIATQWHKCDCFSMLVCNSNQPANNWSLFELVDYCGLIVFARISWYPWDLLKSVSRISGIYSVEMSFLLVLHFATQVSSFFSFPRFPSWLSHH